MRAQVLEALPLRRRIGVLVGLKALSLLLGGLLLVSLVWHRQDAIARVIALVACLTAGVAFRAWELSQRRQFVREARLPTFLGPKLRAQYPQLTDRDVDLVLHGLRQFFMAYVRGGHQFVAMPSKVVDDAWHAFILHTRVYENWCAHRVRQAASSHACRGVGARPQTQRWPAPDLVLGLQGRKHRPQHARPLCPCCSRWTKSWALREASATCLTAATSTGKVAPTPTAAPVSVKTAALPVTAAPIHLAVASHLPIVEMAAAVAGATDGVIGTRIHCASITVLSL
jgi:hypothetical protein